MTSQLTGNSVSERFIISRPPGTPRTGSIAPGSQVVLKSAATGKFCHVVDPSTSAGAIATALSKNPIAGTAAQKSSTASHLQSPRPPRPPRPPQPRMRLNQLRSVQPLLQVDAPPPCPTMLIVCDRCGASEATRFTYTGSGLAAMGMQLITNGAGSPAMLGCTTNATEATMTFQAAPGLPPSPSPRRPPPRSLPPPQRSPPAKCHGKKKAPAAKPTSAPSKPGQGKKAHKAVVSRGGLFAEQASAAPKIVVTASAGASSGATPHKDASAISAAAAARRHAGSERQLAAVDPMQEQSLEVTAAPHVTEVPEAAAVGKPGPGTRAVASATMAARRAGAKARQVPGSAGAAGGDSAASADMPPTDTKQSS